MSATDMDSMIGNTYAELVYSPDIAVIGWQIGSDCSTEELEWGCVCRHGWVGARKVY